MAAVDSENQNQALLDNDASGIVLEQNNNGESGTMDEQNPTCFGWCPALLRTVTITTLVLILLLASRQSDKNGFPKKNRTVLVTGATGRTGSLLYKELQKRGETVRAFVRDAEKAKEVLGCKSCDESEGIYVGDVTDIESLQHAMADGTVTTLAVAIGADPKSSPEIQKAIEFDSVVSSVRSLGMAATKGETSLRVVFCSSMGTETPVPKFGGTILHWKLNAEAFLASSGIQSTIVKPCGLPSDMAGKNSTLVVGHHGAITEGSDYHTISREDLASVMAEAVQYKKHCGNLRFDLCSKPGPPTTDLEGLIERAKWEWDK